MLKNKRKRNIYIFIYIYSSIKSNIDYYTGYLLYQIYLYISGTYHEATMRRIWKGNSPSFITIINYSNELHKV